MLAEILGLKELKQSDMKSIKEKAEELYRIPRGDDTEDTVALDLEKAVTFTEGAYYVLEQIENFMKDSDLGNSAEEKFYKLDVLADIGLFIEQLKK